MLRDYLTSYVRHNRASVTSLAAISFVASALLGLVVGVAHMLVTDYLARMAYLGETPSVTGSTIAFGVVTAISALALVLMLKSAFGTRRSGGYSLQRDVCSRFPRPALASSWAWGLRSCSLRECSR